MNELEKLLARSNKVKIGDAEVDVYSLDFNDLVEIEKLADKDANVRANATKELVKRSLKKSFPEATDEQLGRFDARYINDFLMAVFEASGMDQPRKKLEQMKAE